MGLLDTYLSESIKAKATADVEKPLATSIANEHNAAGFSTFARTVKDVYNNNFDTAIGHYERYCKASTGN